MEFGETICPANVGEDSILPRSRTSQAGTMLGEFVLCRDNLPFIGTPSRPTWREDDILPYIVWVVIWRNYCPAMAVGALKKRTAFSLRQSEFVIWHHFHVDQSSPRWRYPPGTSVSRPGGPYAPGGGACQWFGSAPEGSPNPCSAPRCLRRC